MRFPLVLSLCTLLVSCGVDTGTTVAVVNEDSPPKEELYSIAERSNILIAARAIIESDPTAALVTVDDAGRPRVRSVNTSKPDSSMSIWIATRPGTRKVEQIKDNPNVTLYYNEDASISYLSIMGKAELISDVEIIQAQNPFSEQWTKQFFPNYPDDILLIRIQPVWLEVMGKGIAPSNENWRPQAVVFEQE